MDTEKIKDLESIIKVADLVEACQAKVLISPEERQKYLTKLNDKTHEAIKALIPEEE